MVNGYPSIFGTLFERTLDPDKRAQIGAHYTSRADIETLLQPVVMAPLRREWAEVRAKCDKLWEKIKTAGRVAGKSSKPGKDHDKELRDFVEHLAHVTILDPACGSGNFLYVAINLLLELEKEVIAYAASHGASLLPQVRPTQLHGIEINSYAQQLAQVVIWIGYLQWMHHNGFNAPRDPILEPIESIRLMDAILDSSDPDNPKEPKWPKADFIVGNPPFLGNKMMRTHLGSDYVEPLWRLWGDRLPATSDLCCYWFEKARAAIETNPFGRAGLLATTGIKQVASRRVLERIATSTDIFFAISDRDWVLDGAAVRISIVGFGKTMLGEPLVLDGIARTKINADLTMGEDLTLNKSLRSNLRLCFMGITKIGDFDISDETALDILTRNSPNLRPTSDVVRPFRNGSDLVKVSSNRWIIDFGPECELDAAAGYEAPFEYLVQHVKTARQTNGRLAYRERWWIHGEARPGFRNATATLLRYIATARVAKHRLFVWLDRIVLPDSKVIGVAYDDDFHFGILHSRAHEVWTLATCGLHGGERPTYNPTRSFETFSFPVANQSQRATIAAAAKELDTVRNNWLNPPEWTYEEILEFPGSVDGPWARYVVAPDASGIGKVRFPRVVPKDADAAKKLAKRTLTNLYNERPTWLDLAHKKLDAAVFDAYGWPNDISDDELLARLLALNLERSKQS